MQNKKKEKELGKKITEIMSCGRRRSQKNQWDYRKFKHDQLDLTDIYITLYSKTEVSSTHALFTRSPHFLP